MPDAPQEVESQQPLSHRLLRGIKDAQAQHGLRHNDWARYRKYCSKRLRSTRRVAGLSQGRGKFHKRSIEARAAKNERWLELPLLEAERAWAHAMEMKAALETKPNASKRAHAIRRLTKAARSAGQLASLAAQRGTDRTALEAHVYAAYMTGLALQEKQTDWPAALDAFTRARKLTEQLALVGAYEEQSACRQWAEDIQPAVRFCQYQLDRKGAPSAATEPLFPEQALSNQAAQDKLRTVMKDADLTPATSSASALQWRGQSFAVQGEQAALAVQPALEARAKLSSAQPSSVPAAGSHETQDPRQARLQTLEKLIGAFSKARTALTGLAGGPSGPGRETPAMGSDAASLALAVSGTLVDLQLERSWLLAQLAAERLIQARKANDQTVAATGKVKKMKVHPEDVAVQYERLATLSQELSELASRLGGQAGEALLDESAAKVAHFQAARCLYAGQSYQTAGKLAEAHALFERASQRCSEATSQYEACEHIEREMREQLQQVAAQAAALRCAAHAEAVAGEATDAEGVRKGVGGIHLASTSSGPQTTGESTYLLDNLSSWESFAGHNGKHVRIYPVPPQLTSMPVRPFMLDAALTGIQQPNLEHRIKKAEKASTFSRLFGSWR
ncbi:hypothetical protein WJX74_009011 [Apatococcus lobatus]